ncbi:MAG: type II secretion system protein GspD [Candidatus Brocadiia bacterium]
MRLATSGRLMACVAALGLALGGPAYPDGDHEWSDVQKKSGNPSPSQLESNVNEYTFQDEQINIDGDQDALVKVLRTDQKMLINDYVIGVFPIQNAHPMELRNVFREIAAAEGGRAEVIRDKVKKEYFLFVLAPRFQMPYIEAAVEALDEAWVSDDIDGSHEVYYKARFRDIERVHEIATVPASADIRGEGEDNNVDLDTVNNAALLIGEPYRSESYVKYARQVDQPIPQLLLEAAVYEVEVSKETRLGLDYIAWKNGPGRNLFDFVHWGADHKQVARNITSVYDPFLPARLPVVGKQTVASGDVSGRYYAVNYLLTTSWLDFLAGSGRARVITKGKVLIKNGQTGSLTAVDEVIHFRTDPDEDNTPVFGINPSQPFEGNDLTVYNRTLHKDGRLEIGFVLDVRPLIAQETTQLSISMALNNIVGQTPSGAPQVRTHSLATTVLVADGQPICIGGLRRTEEVDNAAKMPILGSIPLLGYAFGHQASAQRETEVVVVLHPTIRFGSEADLEMASEEDKLVRAQVQRRADLPLPKTEFGFDQWLLDQSK